MTARLVDLHCHGGGGHTVGTSVEATLGALAAHRRLGTDALVASLVSLPLERTVAALEVIRRAGEQDPGVLGAHLEGPFLSPRRKGAHDPHALADPSAALVDDLIAAGDGCVRQVTIAPELPGALEAISRFADAGVVVAVGHTEADAALTREAFAAGATLLTHAFNAMPGIAAREPGPVGAALANPAVVLEVIADGVHVDPALIAAVFAAAPGRVVLVTDAMAAAGSPDGDYRLGALEVQVREGRAVVAGTETLAGSTLTLTRAIEVAVAAGVERDAAVAAASTVPLRVLGIA